MTQSTFVRYFTRVRRDKSPVGAGLPRTALDICRLTEVSLELSLLDRLLSTIAGYIFKFEACRASWTLNKLFRAFFDLYLYVAGETRGAIVAVWTNLMHLFLRF